MCYLADVVKNPTLKQMARASSIKITVSRCQAQLLKKHDRPATNRNRFEGKKGEQNSSFLLEFDAAVKPTRGGSLWKSSPAETAIPVSNCKAEKDNTVVEREASLFSRSRYAVSSAREYYQDYVGFLTVCSKREATDCKILGSSCGLMSNITISSLGPLQQVPIQWWKSSIGHVNDVRLSQPMPEQAASITYKDHYIQINTDSARRITNTLRTDTFPMCVSSGFTAARAQQFSGSCSGSYLAGTFLPSFSAVWHCFGGAFPTGGKVAFLNLGNTHPAPLFPWRHCSRAMFGCAYSTASPGSGMWEEHLEQDLKKIQEKIQEAGEVLDEAKESLGTVYFSRDMEEAEQLVEETVELYKKVLFQCSSSAQKEKMLFILGPRIEEIKSRQVQLQQSVHH